MMHQTQNGVLSLYLPDTKKYSETFLYNRVNFQHYKHDLT